MAASEQVAVLPLNISRGLTDKLVEKRKGAALELEKFVLHFKIYSFFTDYNSEY